MAFLFQGEDDICIRIYEYGCILSTRIKDILNFKAGNEFYEPKNICLDMRHTTLMKVNNNNNEKKASKMRVFKKWFFEGLSTKN